MWSISSKMSRTVPPTASSSSWTYGDDYPLDDLVDAPHALSDVDQALRDSANREVTQATLVAE
jgi:hypothetical protein